MKKEEKTTTTKTISLRFCDVHEHLSGKRLQTFELTANVYVRASTLCWYTQTPTLRRSLYTQTQITRRTLWPRESRLVDDKIRGDKKCLLNDVTKCGRIWRKGDGKRSLDSVSESGILYSSQYGKLQYQLAHKKHIKAVTNKHSPPPESHNV